MLGLSTAWASKEFHSLAKLKKKKRIVKISEWRANSLQWHMQIRVYTQIKRKTKGNTNDHLEEVQQPEIEDKKCWFKL